MPTMSEIQAAWAANAGNPQAVYDAMMQNGVSYRDAAQAAGMTTQELNQFLAAPISSDNSRPYTLHTGGYAVNSQGMPVDDPDWRSKIDMRQYDPDFGYTDPSHNRANDPFAIDMSQSQYAGLGNYAILPGANNIGGKPMQYTGSTNRPGAYVAPNAGVDWQQNNQPGPGLPSIGSPQWYLPQFAGPEYDQYRTATASPSGGELQQYNDHIARVRAINGSKVQVPSFDEWNAGNPKLGGQNAAPLGFASGGAVPTQQEIAAFYAANANNPAAIQAAMAQYGVSPEQAAAATGQTAASFQQPQPASTGPSGVNVSNDYLTNQAQNLGYNFGGTGGDLQQVASPVAFNQNVAGWNAQGGSNGMESGVLTTKGGQQVTSQQLRDFAATNPNDQQIMAEASRLGMNMDNLGVALNNLGLLFNNGDPRSMQMNDSKNGSLYNRLSGSAFQGSTGYGIANNPSGGFNDTGLIVAGNGHTWDDANKKWDRFGNNTTGYATPGTFENPMGSPAVMPPFVTYKRATPAKRTAPIGALTRVAKALK